MDIQELIEDLQEDYAPEMQVVKLVLETADGMLLLYGRDVVEKKEE